MATRRAERGQTGAARLVGVRDLVLPPVHQRRVPQHRQGGGVWSRLRFFVQPQHTHGLVHLHQPIGVRHLRHPVRRPDLGRQPGGGGPIPAPPGGAGQVVALSQLGCPPALSSTWPVAGTPARRVDGWTFPEQLQFAFFPGSISQVVQRAGCRAAASSSSADLGIRLSLCPSVLPVSDKAIFGTVPEPPRLGAVWAPAAKAGAQNNGFA